MLLAMTTTKRRPKGTRANTVTVFGMVDAHASAVLDDIWAATTDAKWSAVEVILFHVGSQLDDKGLPSWWPTEGLPKRRGRGSRDEDYAPVFAPVDPEAAAVLDRIVAVSGAGKAIALEAILHWVGTQLSDNGLPTWWPVPSIQQEALIPA